MTDLSDIPITTRRSKRAKRIFLRYIRQKGVEVVIPYRAKGVDIQALLDEHSQWIQKQHQQSLKQHHLNPIPAFPPEQLELRSLGRSIRLTYQETPHPFVRLQAVGDNLQLSGAITEQDKVRSVLVAWLKQQAKKALTPWMQRLSQETGLAYQYLGFRGQKTRWGSCSSDKRISLNYKLIFLPPELVEHIMLHELCHLVHINHSKRFWALLRKLDPSCDANNQACAPAESLVPLWLESQCAL